MSYIALAEIVVYNPFVEDPCLRKTCIKKLILQRS